MPNITTTTAGRTEKLTHLVIDGTVRALSTPVAANWTRNQLVAAINSLGLTGVSAANGTGANDINATGFSSLAVQTEREIWNQTFSSHSGVRGNPSSFNIFPATGYQFRPHTQNSGFTSPGDMGVGNGAAYNWNKVNWAMPMPLTAAKASGGTNDDADNAQNYNTTPNASGVNGGSWLAVDHAATAGPAFTTTHITTPGGANVFAQFRWKQNFSGRSWNEPVAPDGAGGTSFPNRNHPFFQITKPTAEVRIGGASGSLSATAKKDNFHTANDGLWRDADTNIFPVPAANQNVSLEIHTAANAPVPSRATTAGTAGDGWWQRGNDMLYGDFRLVRIDRSHPTWQTITASANNSVFSAPQTQTAYGSRKLVVNFDVKDQNGNALDKPGLTFTVDSGTVSVTSYTAATGRYVLEYTPAAEGTNLHNLLIRAMEGNNVFDSDGVLIKINPAVITVTWNIAPATTNVSNTPQNITATVADQYGEKNRGTARKIGFKDNTSLGTIGASTWNAATGVFTAPYTPSAAGTIVFELETAAGTDSGYADSPTKTVTVAAVATSVTFTGGSPMVVNGASTTVQAVVRDQNGNPIDDGGTSTFTVTGGTGATVTKAYAGNGVYNLTLTPGSAVASLVINKTNAPTGSAAAIQVSASTPTINRKMIDIRPAVAVIPQGWLCVRSDVTYQVYKVSDWVSTSTAARPNDENRVLKSGATPVELFATPTTTNNPLTTLQSNSHGEPWPRGPWYVTSNEDYVVIARFGNGSVVSTQWVSTK